MNSPPGRTLVDQRAAGVEVEFVGDGRDLTELALLDAFDTRKLPPDGHALGTSG